MCRKRALFAISLCGHSDDDREDRIDMHRNTFYSNSYQPTRPASSSSRISARRAGKSSHNMFSDQRAHRKFHAGWFFLVLIGLVMLLFLYAAVDGSIVRVEHVQVTIPGMDRAFEGYTILHISDLHGKRFGPAQRQLAEALSKARFNAVCISGDVTAPDGDPYAFYELLDILDPSKYPVFFTEGDDDPPALIGEPHYISDVFAEFITGAQRKGAIYLDAPREVSYNGKSIWFVPGSQLSLDLDNAEAQFRNQLKKDQEGGNANTPGIKARERLINYRLEVIERTRQAEAAMQTDGLRIALVHSPLRSDFIRTLQSAGGTTSTGSAYARVLDLVLAGHYNGGQVRLPFLGPIYVPGDDLPRGGWFPGDRRTQGLSQVSGIAQYISPGLGVSGAYSIPIRLFNSPKVTLLKLTSSLPLQ